MCGGLPARCFSAQAPDAPARLAASVVRYQASRDDLAVYVAMSGAPSAPHTARWYAHISALLGSRYGRHGFGRQRRSTLAWSTLPDASTTHVPSFPGKAVGVSVGGAASAASSGAPAAAAAPAKPAAVDDDDDDELDLFGDDTEEEKAAKMAVIEKAKARGVEKAKLSKSMIVLDVKPWDDETDLAELEKFVRAVEHDGLLWGASKLVPVGFGIKKLQITAVIQDSKVPSFDAIIEDHLVQDGENPFIQVRVVYAAPRRRDLSPVVSSACIFSPSHLSRRAPLSLLTERRHCLIQQIIGNFCGGVVQYRRRLVTSNDPRLDSNGCESSCVSPICHECFITRQLVSASLSPAAPSSLCGSGASLGALWATSRIKRQVPVSSRMATAAHAVRAARPPQYLQRRAHTHGAQCRPKHTHTHHLFARRTRPGRRTGPAAARVWWWQTPGWQPAVPGPPSGW